MHYKSIKAYIAILLLPSKLAASHESTEMILNSACKTLYLNEPECNNINENVLKEYLHADHLIIKETSMKAFPNNLENLIKIEKITCINNQFMTNWDNLFNLPKEFKNNIKSLTIENCNLEELPHQISEFSNLHTLSLNFNNLSKLPDSICELKNLKTLLLDYNKLQELPINLGNLFNLDTLTVRSNKLSSLPNTFYKLQNLAYLALSFNQLSIIPIHIHMLANLRHLNMQNNKVYKLFPNIDEINEFRIDLEESLDLNAIDIFHDLHIPRNYNNYLIKRNLDILLTGTTLLSRLESFNINYNQIDEITDDIQYLYSLKILSANNNVIRKISASLFTLPRLNFLGLSKNCLRSVPLLNSSIDTSNLIFLLLNNIIDENDIENVGIGTKSLKKKQFKQLLIDSPVIKLNKKQQVISKIDTLVIS